MLNMKNSTVAQAACAIISVVFIFCYLFFYQVDILTVGQHVLSGGKTHYSPVVGTILLVFILQLLAEGIGALTHLRYRYCALNYFPSFLILTIITSTSTHFDANPSFGAWLWAVPLLLLVYIFVLWIASQMQILEKNTVENEPQAKILWPNLAIMLLWIMLTVGFSQNDETFHQRIRMERLISSRHYDEALMVGNYNDLKADSNMTMLRIYALARQHQLGEKLFEYPLKGGAEAMLPNGTSVHSLILSDTLIVKTTRYSKDYHLCSMLLKRDLTHFALHLAKVYDLRKPLPRYYAEALYIYNKVSARPLVKYKNEKMEQQFALFMKNKNRFKDSYWYYYYK